MIYCTKSIMNFFKKKEPLQPVKPVAIAGDGLEEISELLERTLAVEEENNRILKRMQIMGRFSFWLKVVIWSLLLGLPVLFFQPIVDFLKSSLQEHGAVLGIPTSEELQQAYQQYSSH